MSGSKLHLAWQVNSTLDPSAAFSDDDVISMLLSQAKNMITLEWDEFRVAAAVF